MGLKKQKCRAGPVEPSNGLLCDKDGQIGWFVVTYTEQRVVVLVVGANGDRKARWMLPTVEKLAAEMVRVHCLALAAWT